MSFLWEPPEKISLFFLMKKYYVHLQIKCEINYFGGVILFHVSLHSVCKLQVGE